MVQHKEPSHRRAAASMGSAYAYYQSYVLFNVLQELFQTALL
jgi:hypothetical protein